MARGRLTSTRNRAGRNRTEERGVISLEGCGVALSVVVRGRNSAALEVSRIRPVRMPEDKLARLGPRISIWVTSLEGELPFVILSKGRRRAPVTRKGGSAWRVKGNTAFTLVAALLTGRARHGDCNIFLGRLGLRCRRKIGSISVGTLESILGALVVRLQN